MHKVLQHVEKKLRGKTGRKKLELLYSAATSGHPAGLFQMMYDIYTPYKNEIVEVPVTYEKPPVQAKGTEVEVGSEEPAMRRVRADVRELFGYGGRGQSYDQFLKSQGERDDADGERDTRVDSRPPRNRVYRAPHHKGRRRQGGGQEG